VRAWHFLTIGLSGESVHGGGKKSAGYTDIYTGHGRGESDREGENDRGRKRERERERERL